MSAKMKISAALVIYSFSTIVLADTADCEKNFTTTGSFISGKQYKTVISSASVAKDEAYKKAYTAVVKGGYQIVNSDKDVGVISAAQSVSYSQGGKTAPLNLLIETQEAGSQLTLTFSTSGGVSASSGDVIKEFCRISSETY